MPRHPRGQAVLVGALAVAVLIPACLLGPPGLRPLMSAGLGGLAVLLSGCLSATGGWRRWLAPVPALVALAAACSVWLARGGTTGPALAAGGALALFACLPLLVWRRRAPPGLARLGLVALWCLAGGGASAIIQGIGSEAVGLLVPVARLVWPLLAILVAVVAVEMLVRQLLDLAVDSPSPRGADSIVAGLLGGDARSGGATLRAWLDRCGLDATLAGWARAFLARAAVPLLLVLLVAGWAATGATSLGVAERGILERFGAPVAVLGPGVHVHLPWPLARVRRLDYGVERATPLGIPTGTLALARAGVEAASSAADDRLWDTAHGREILFLTAGRGGADQRGVRRAEITNADIVVHWRIGLDEVAARDAAYAVIAPEDLVLRQARRRVQSVFAAATPDSLLGTDRQQLAERMRRAVQAALDAHHAGVEVMAVHFEAIHPPCAAATALYQAQAAERDAAAQVSAARGQAEGILASAQVQASSERDEGQARAAEILAGARMQEERSRADCAAAALGASAALEARLDALAAALAGRRLIVLDHRLPAGQEQSIDLRRLPRPAAATAPGPQD